jgi:hypothetical protein
VQYIYTDAGHTSPLRRVTPLELIERKGHEYDKDRYCEMLLDAAETLLGYFGFDRRPSYMSRSSIIQYLNAFKMTWHGTA